MVRNLEIFVVEMKKSRHFICGLSFMEIVYLQAVKHETRYIPIVGASAGVQFWKT